MNRRSVRVALVTSLAALASFVAARAAEPEPVDREPLLRLETDGPAGLVTGLAFRPDGRVLYEAGWDKVVRAWTLGEGAAGFRLDPRSTLRVPIGPALGGAINAMALSPDGRWLAVAGNGVIPGAAGFRQAGLVVPRRGLSDDDRRAQGEIFVFDTTAVPPRCRRLRGHLGPVYALAFAEPGAAAPVLASVATEPDGKGVVRLWDAASGAYLGGAVGPAQAGYRPGLAAWRAGDARGAVRVAATWGDAAFHVWDFTPDGAAAAVATVDDGRANQVLVHLADRAVIATGSFDEASLQGRLRFRDAADPRGGPGAAAGFPVVPLSLAADGSGRCVPQAAALLATRPGGPADALAVVAQEVRPDGAGREFDFVLLLIDLRPARLGAVLARAPLWRGPKVQPAIASAVGGRHVAVAGNIDRSVAVFAVDDLVAGRAVPQRLRNHGVTMRGVAFARNGTRRGLILSEHPVDRPGDPPRPPGAGDMVLDVTGSRLSNDPAGWSVAAPPAGGWRAEGGPGQGTVTVFGGDAAGRRIVVPPNAEVTALAVLPPGLGVATSAVVAVGLNEPGAGPSLWLYDVASGAAVRQFSGHTGRVRGLAFSADGLELASAADDQTVAVWNLRDLGQVLGRRGGLTGVELDREGDRVVVASVAADSPYQRDGTLRAGDALLGLREGAAAPAIATPGEFYLAVSRVAPGGSVTVRRERRGLGVSDVTLRLGQAADERKPLFSVFVSEGKAAGARSWLGWSPLGPYDASGPEAESLFGWHFNTGQAETPTRFALGTEYRDLRRPNLLNDLLERGALPPPPAPPPLPAPKLSFVVDPDAAPDGLGHLFLRRPPEGVGMIATANPPPADRVASATWQLDGGPAFPLKTDSAGHWSADPAAAEWARGVHKLTATLRTSEARPQTFLASRVVRVQPPAPSVESDLPGRTLDVTEPRFTYRARVAPSDSSPADVSLTAYGEKGLVFEKSWKTDRPLVIEETMSLPTGVTTFTLVAVNRGALAGFESFETARLGPISVTYRRTPARPPVIALAGVVPLSPGGGDGERLPVVDDRPVVVDVPGIRVEGTLTAEAPLSAAERFVLGDAENGRPLDGFAADRGKTFHVREPLTLRPGRNTVRFRARAGGDDGEWRESRLSVEFRPPAPGVVSVALDPGEGVTYASRAGEPPTVRVVAKLSGFAEGAVLDKASVVINGVESSAGVDQAASVVTAVVALRPGANEIQVRLRNRWGGSRTTDPERVVFARPPRVVAVECPPPGERPLVSVAARVESPSPLTRAEVEFQTRGAGNGPARVRRFDLSVGGPENGVWTVAARDVPVEPGETGVRVRAWNEDGPAREPGPEARFVFRKPTPPPPEVEFLSPGRDATVSLAAARVRYRVRSTSPLVRAVLVRDGPGARRGTLATADVKKVGRDASGRFELVVEAEVNLLRGENLLRAEAVNDGGEGAAAVVLSYVAPPVQVVIDRVEPFAKRGATVVPVDDGPGRLTAREPLSDGRVAIHGRVIGIDREVMGRIGAARLQVWVNGFPQVIATPAPRPDRPLEARFRAELVLARESNEVELRLQGLAREISDRTTMAVRCLDPVRGQKLHLLVIGVGVNPADESRLRDRALQALRGRLLPGSAREFETPAFPQGQIYAVLCGDVYRSRLNGQVYRIQKVVGLGERASNDVVVIYYQGTETVEGGRESLRLCAHDPDRIGVDEVINCFASTRGATLLLLDVARAAGEPRGALAESPPWPEGDSRFGLLRFVWRGQPDTPKGAPPEDARLITALRESMPGAVTLGDLATQLARRAGALTSRYPNFGFDQFLPGELTGLIVGAPGK